MQTFSTKAIILNRQDFRENDLRVVVYSKDYGKLELVARGAKKQTSKMAGHVEPFNLVNLMAVKGKQFDYIGSAISNNCFTNIKNDFDKVSAAGKSINIFNKSIKPEYPDQKIFYLLEDFLIAINNNLDLSILSISFKLKLMALLGYVPELYNCII